MILFLSACDIGTPLPENTILPHAQGIMVGGQARLACTVEIGHQITSG